MNNNNKDKSTVEDQSDNNEQGYFTYFIDSFF
jgi:hypothetical protein